MSREQRAELEKSQTRLREVKEALKTSITPGFIEEREALAKALPPLRTEAAALDERTQFLEKQARSAEAEVQAIAVQLQSNRARNEASLFAAFVASALGVGMLWFSIELSTGPRTPLVIFETMLAAAVPAFLLGALLRLRILPKSR